MSNSTRVHHYPFTLRTAALAITGFEAAQDKFYFYLIPPEKALTIESLYFQLQMVFFSAVAPADRVITHVGIASNFPMFITDEPERLRTYEINAEADANRRVNVDIDLTALLKKDDAEYRNQFSNHNAAGATYVYFKTADGTRGSGTGTIEICKADGLFTTEAIA